MNSMTPSVKNPRLRARRGVGGKHELRDGVYLVVETMTCPGADTGAGT